MYRWIVFLHVVSSFTFFMAHSISIGVALRLRHERQLDRVRSLLELSNLSKVASNISLLILLVCGVVAGFMGNWWHMGWIWLALALMIFMSVGMALGMSPSFNRLRKAVGSPYTDGMKKKPAQQPVDAKAIETMLVSTRMEIPAGIGLAIMAGILYLMMFKPF